MEFYPNDKSGYVDPDIFVKVFARKLEEEKDDLKKRNLAVVYNPERVENFGKACEDIEEYFSSDPSVKIHKKFRKHDLITDARGCVKVNGKEIVIDTPGEFVELINMASNYCITPKIDDTIDLEFTFNELSDMYDIGGAK